MFRDLAKKWGWKVASAAFFATMFVIGQTASAFGALRDAIPTPEGTPRGQPDRAQSALGIFGVLVFGAIALVVTSITLLFGMDIAGEFADGISVDNDYSDEANSTVNSTGQAFELFGTSVLVIPAAAVLTVLIGGMVGAVASVQGGNLPGGGRGR